MRNGTTDSEKVGREERQIKTKRYIGLWFGIKAWGNICIRNYWHCITSTWAIIKKTFGK